MPDLGKQSTSKETEVDRVVRFPTSVLVALRVYCSDRDMTINRFIVEATSARLREALERATPPQEGQ